MATERVLGALCDGEVSLDKLLTLVSRDGLELMIKNAAYWINLYAPGDEMFIIGSPARWKTRAR